MVPIVAVTANAAEGDKTYTKVGLADIQSTDTVIIVSTKGTASYAMSNDNGTGSAPKAISVTITDNSITSNATNILWNIARDSNNLTIYPAGTTTKWLYCTATNNGVRVGTNANKIFTLDSTSGYLKHAATNRYLGVYNNQDWRCYTNTTGNIAGQTFSFYKLVDTSTPDPTVPTECEHTNTKNVAEVPATCTTPGTTAGVVCSDCNAIISGCEVIPATGHTEVIDEAKAATCTETGLTEGKHCSVCNEVLVAQTVVPMIAHNYENGTCTVCGKKQPTGLTINRGSFGEASGYAWHGWTATATTGETISGYGYIYGGTKDSIQVNANQTGNFIYNETPLPGSITSITLTAYKTTFRDFYVVTSPEPFNKETNKLNPTDVEAQNVTTSGATWKFTTTDRYFAIVVTGGAAYLSSIEITYEACSHENTVNVDAVPATCTETGYTAGVYCNACGTYISGHEEIAALGHSWLGWTETKAPTCTTTGVQTGTCSRCGETKTVEIPTTDHTYVDGTCSVCGATKTETTNRYYIATIRTTGNYFCMTNELVGTNTMRYMAVDSGLTTLPEKIAAPEANKVFVLVDNGDGTYYIYAEGRTGDNYLGWASENSGAFVAEEAAKRLTKTDNDDGTYSFYFNDGTKDRYLSLNENTGSDFFAWYAGTQKQNLVLIPVEGEAATPAEKNPIVKWNITLEDNLKVNFHLELNEGEQVYLKVGSAEVAYNLSDLTKTAEGYYVATVSMAAAQMTDDINVQVINLTNEKLLANKTYSIRGYADAVLGSEKYPETTKALVKEMLNYGGAAQAFFGYNTGNLANAGITGAGVTPVPESVASDMIKENDSDGCITFYGASLVYRDKIAVRYYFDAKEGQNLTFMADGQEREPVLTGGHYMIEVPDICPQDYATQITVTVTNAEGHSATVSYGPMNYIVRMYYKAGATTEMQNLLQALYNYHLAAVAYIAAQNP